MKASGRVSAAKVERKTVERNRRIHMKNLCFKLGSLLPPRYHKEVQPQQDQLIAAAAYIRKLRMRIEALEKRRDQAEACAVESRDLDGMGAPVIEVRDLGSSVEVVLISSSLNHKSMLSDVISVIQEAGAAVVNASFSHFADKVLYTIHSQVTSSRVGFEADRAYEKLKELFVH